MVDGFAHAPHSVAVRVRAAVVADLGAFSSTTRKKVAIEATSPLSFGAFTPSAAMQPPPATNTSGFVGTFFTAGVDWFEQMHVIRRKYAFGFVLATTVQALEVYNAYRKQNNTWTTFTNNAGIGVSLLGQPILPVTVFAQGGIVMSLQVSTQGAGVVNSTLDFVFSVETIMVPITLQRVFLAAFRPEDEYVEELEWGTDVLLKVDGTEARPSYRENPVQRFRHRFYLEDSSDPGSELEDSRALVENLIFDWQHRVFGLAIWDQERELSQAAVATATTIFVDSTDFADFRVGGLVCVYQGSRTFDIAVISSFTPTSITMASGLQNSYPAGTAVLPLRTAYARPLISGERSLNTASAIEILFRVIDNDVGTIASLAAFPAYQGKLLMDGHNFAEPSTREEFERDMIVFDNETGLVFQDSTWPNGRRASQWRKFTRGPQETWQHRQALHAIRGRQVSWYLPTSRDDLRPILALTSGSAALDVANVGYTQFVKSRQPKNHIRVTFNNGSASLLRKVLSSVVVDATRETLTLDATWPSTVPVSQVDRVEFVEEVRFDSDVVSILHGGAGDRRFARFDAPVRAMLL